MLALFLLLVLEEILGYVFFFSAAPTACPEKSLENLYNGGDQGSNADVALWNIRFSSS
jgi:hypothetical protein